MGLKTWASAGVSAAEAWAVRARLLCWPRVERRLLMASTEKQPPKQTKASQAEVVR